MSDLNPKWDSPLDRVKERDNETVRSRWIDEMIRQSRIDYPELFEKKEDESKDDKEENNESGTPG